MAGSMGSYPLGLSIVCVVATMLVVGETVSRAADGDVTRGPAMAEARA